MRKWIRWWVVLVGFAGFYAVEILRSNWRVAGDVLARRPALSPGVVAVPWEDLNDRQVVVLACLLTMTPGTLSLEADAKTRRLYLHCLYTEPSAEELRRHIKERYVRPIQILA